MSKMKHQTINKIILINMLFLIIVNVILLISIHTILQIKIENHVCNFETQECWNSYQTIEDYLKGED